MSHNFRICDSDRLYGVQIACHDAFDWFIGFISNDFKIEVSQTRYVKDEVVADYGEERPIKLWIKGKKIHDSYPIAKETYFLIKLLKKN